jgi:hypothetical protein
MSERFQKTKPSFLEAGLPCASLLLSAKLITMPVSVLPRTGYISGGHAGHRQLVALLYCQVCCHTMPISVRRVPMCSILWCRQRTLMSSLEKNANISNFIGISLRESHRLTCLESMANCSWLCAFSVIRLGSMPIAWRQRKRCWAAQAVQQISWLFRIMTSRSIDADIQAVPRESAFLSRD